MQDGYDLWQAYVEKAFSWEEEYKERMVTLRYEDFLDNPFEQTKKLARFCGLEATDAEIKQVVKEVDTSRKYAFTKDENSIAFYNTIKDNDWMKKLKYNDILEIS